MNPTRFFHTVRLAFRSLRLHRLRSALTTLGVVLGVASVIVMLAVGEAAKYESLKQLEDLGANTILLRSVKPAEDGDRKQNNTADMIAYGLKTADLDRIRATIPTVTNANPMREFRKTVRYADKKIDARIVAVTPDFLPQNSIRILAGRGIESVDEARYANVCVLGGAAAEVLFPTADPVGRGVAIETTTETKTYVVVGVTEPKTLAGGGGGENVDFNRVVFIPFATDRARFGPQLVTLKAGSQQMERLEISQITVTVDALENVPKTANVLKSLVDQYHPEKDVTLFVPLDLLRKAEETQRLFTMVLAAIAGISLVVGGIGIMNIMLATVTERTKEIGIRRALGAKKRDIAVQFLVEAVVLTCGGGVLGVVAGVALAEGVKQTFGLPTIIQLWSPAAAFGVSVVVGLASGIYPARRAADLDPIEALRRD